MTKQTIIKLYFDVDDNEFGTLEYETTMSPVNAQYYHIHNELDSQVSIYASNLHKIHISDSHGLLVYTYCFKSDNITDLKVAMMDGLKSYLDRNIRYFRQYIEDYTRIKDTLFKNDKQI